jgi:proteasome lid subunit RPN8/RPN11
MNEEVRAAALAHARAEYPREACGLVVVVRGRARYWPCRNEAAGTEHFVLAPADYAAAEDAGDVAAVFHSHPNAAPDPSQADRVACEASGLPWHIVGVPCGRWAQLQPTGYRAPLIGREFSHGVLDCYTLVRDYYAEVLGITLPDFERHENWWRQGKSLYVDNYAKAGFQRQLGEPRTHDLILIQVRANVPNHGAIYLGNDMLLHHLHGRLSCREPWGGYYKKHAVMTLRHHTLCAT